MDYKAVIEEQIETLQKVQKGMSSDVNEFRRIYE